MKIADLKAAAFRRVDIGPGAEAYFTLLSGAPGESPDPDMPLVMGEQTHSDHIFEAVADTDAPADTDALVTCRPGLAIAVRTADCVPVVVNAPDIGYVAAIHAGWRGTIAGIVAGTVAMLKGKGASPGAMRAYIGPCICRDCYEVDADLAARFAAGYPDCVSPGAPGKGHIDLRAVNRRQLLDAGLPPEHITVSTDCTRHSGTHYPSYRREGPAALRLYSIVMRTEEVRAARVDPPV